MKKKIALLLSVILIVTACFNLSVSAEVTAKIGGKVTTANTNLLVRKSATVNSEILVSLKKDSFITLISKNGDWWKVEYAKNKYGYCSGKYVTEISRNTGYAKITSGYLNVRKSGSSESSVIGKLSKNEKFVILQQGNTWSEILFNGNQIGYANNKYIGLLYTAVSLNIKDYKQTDKKWADVKLGNSNATIKSSGCVVSCLANTESYRTGTDITPKKLATTLSFTSGGAVYWPENYKFYSNNDYLKIIYNKLKDGKPVIIGAKSSKSTHYVTVYGFKGASKLTAADFLIKDPGSSSRKNLQQFFNSYPNFIKLVFYK